jgi:YidC/Oxa1 family membrane protein insertase
MEKRLLLAFLLMGLVLFVTPYIYKPAPPPKATQSAAANQAAQKAADKPEAAVAPKPKPETAAPAAPGQIQDTSEKLFNIETDIYRIQLSNRGAVVKSWMLKKYLDHSGKPLELVNQASFDKVPPPFSVVLKDDAASNVLNYGYFVAKPAADGLSIDYEFSDGKLYGKKSFQFSKNGYLSQVLTEVTQNGAPVDHMVQWRGGFGDATVTNRAADQHSLYYDLGQSKLITKAAGDAKNGPISTAGNYSFAGLDDRFFGFVVLPKDNTSTKVVALKDDAPVSLGAKDEQHIGVQVGGDSINRFVTFVGPKDVDLIQRVDPKLTQLIDWGFFGIIAKPIFLVLHWMNDNLVHNYGWSIVLITIVINILLMPFRLSSMKQQRKMQKLQPQIAAINAKYKGLSLRDPKKAEQNQEIMDLYKREGANPMSGCLPMVVQLPILYAFYKVLTVTIELRGAHWLWVSDLSQPEQLAIRALPVLLIVTQFIVQKMTPNPTMDPSQAKMMQFMPLMFGFFFYNVSSGLVLYWLTGNLVGILQQALINRLMPAPPVQPVKVPAKRKS